MDRLLPNTEVIDFSKEERFSNIAYAEPTAQVLNDFKNFVKSNKDTIVRMYHGTNSEFNILQEGLKPTTNRSKRSIQSSIGYVYLNIYPSMAKTFGEMAYPQTEITVYSVDISLGNLVADKDQLSNKRYWSEKCIGNTLADSISYGHGARVKGKIESYKISKHSN